MPPSPAFGWLCVAHTVADITFRAAQIRATKVLPSSQSLSVPATEGKSHSAESNWITVNPVVTWHLTATNVGNTEVSSAEPTSKINHTPFDRVVATHVTTRAEDDVDKLRCSSPKHSAVHGEPAPSKLKAVSGEQNDVFSSSVHGANLIFVGWPIEITPAFPTVTQSVDLPMGRSLHSSKVPSSRIGRLFHYGGLAASLGYGVASEIVRRSTTTSGDSPQGSLMLTEANIKRLVSKLSQMRGAALKLGQFMSIQDTHVLPPDLDMVLRRVQDSAHYMPDWQMEEVLVSSLGPSWADNFTSFDRVPFAAASIGQVHAGVLASSASPTGVEEQVAVKIQFPNIANSIASDLGYVKLLLTAGKLLPKGLFLDRTVQVMKEELADECNYLREAQFLERYRSAELLGQDRRFKIPWVWEGSTDRVLVMEHVDGISVGELSVSALPQEERNEIATRILELCLRELFDFRMMQTDPNWSNFLWDSSAQQVSLVDFGATREYTKGFMDDWLHLLQAAASGDRSACADWSVRLGYLTGRENETMVNAHVDSMILLATPFKSSTPQPFVFGPGSRWEDIASQIRANIPIMLQHRLTPPPRETYSLNRKLSGAFLLASRLRAVVNTKRLWDNVVNGYQFGE